MSIEINRSIHRKYCLAQERYLIDGDLDLILRRPVPRLKHLYRLKVYCMENRLLSEFAAVAIGTECATDIGWHDMALRLSFRALMEAPVQKLLPLFIVYSVVQKLGLTIETVGYPVQRLLKVPSDPETLSGHLVRKRMRELISGIQFRTSATKYGRMRDPIWNGVAAHAGRLGSFLLFVREGLHPATCSPEVAQGSQFCRIPREAQSSLGPALRTDD